MSIKTFIILCVMLLVLFVGLKAAHKIANSRSFQFFGAITHRIVTGEKIVALTLDDGPTDRTREILRTLDSLGIKATFYVTGGSLKAHLDYGRMIVGAGHELGNHSYTHSRMVLMSTGKIEREIERTDSLILQTGYKGTITFRPPYGKKMFGLPHYLYKHNRHTIMWDVEPEAPTATTQEMVNTTLQQVQPGSIILLHVMIESRQSSRAAVAGIVTGLQEKGFRFVTISQLLAYKKQ